MDLIPINLMTNGGKIVVNLVTKILKFRFFMKKGVEF